MHFKRTINGKVEIFRFDYFRQWMQEVYWFPNCNRNPDFVIDYNSFKFLTMVESKLVRMTGQQAYYYPGFTFSFKCARDPLPKIITFFFPAVILGICLLTVF